MKHAISDGIIRQHIHSHSVKVMEFFLDVSVCQSIKLVHGILRDIVITRTEHEILTELEM